MPFRTHIIIDLRSNFFQPPARNKQESKELKRHGGFTGSKVYHAHLAGHHCCSTRLDGDVVDLPIYLGDKIHRRCRLPRREHVSNHLP